MASSIKGLDKLLAGLDRASVKFQGDVKTILDNNLTSLELQAIRDAPGPSDRIATEFGTENEKDIREAKQRGWYPINQSIAAEENANGYGGRVFVNDSAGDIAAWVEFGTGQSAKTYLMSVEPEWRDVAAKYIRNKQGTILNAPYLYPAFTKYSLLTIKEIKQAMKDIKL